MSYTDNLLDDEIGAAYSQFREAIICAGAHEEQLKTDIKVLEESGKECQDIFLSTYVQVSLTSTAAVLDQVVQQIDKFSGSLPLAALNDIDVLKENIKTVLPNSVHEIDYALEELASAGCARAWLERIKKDAAGRRDVYRLGTHLINGERSSLSDLFKLRNTILSESRTSLIGDLTSDTQPPEPQPFIILCAFGPPGARLVCVVALAVAIGSSSHNVE